MRAWAAVAALCVGVTVAIVAARRAGDAWLVDWKDDPDALARDRQTLSLALHRAPTRVERASGPDIVVIVLDTLRADRLRAYGSDGSTTPRIDTWAASARVYTHMRSVAAWTLPSHASLFTGLYPYSHGARGVPADAADIAAPLGSMPPTVAEELRARGYITLGISANRAFLDRAWGLARGFDVYLCGELRADARRLPYPPADRITALAEHALSSTQDGGRFLFLNYMDAHAPWVPRKGYVREPEHIDRGVLPYGRGWDAASEAALATGSVSVPTARSWSEAYDADVRFLDERVGRLLERLPDLGVDGNDYVFVLSDHGEYLGEHGLVEHSKDLYEPVLRVPLLARGPGYAAGLDDTAVQTTDVARMVLTAAGAEPLGVPLPAGLSLSELYWSRRKDLRNPVYGARFDRVRRAFHAGMHKVIVGTDGSYEAYDLATDPGEARSQPDASWAVALRERGEDVLAGLPASEATTDFTGPRNTEALRELGYVE